MGLELRATDRVEKSESIERHTNTLLVWVWYYLGHNERSTIHYLVYHIHGDGGSCWRKVDLDHFTCFFTSVYQSCTNKIWING